MFQSDRIYRRSDLHDLFGGQRQGGISTPAHESIIFLFTGEGGEQHGYSDGWSGDRFLYFGEGQHGDMEFTRGNAAIRDHADQGKVLYLFQQHGKGMVKFISEMTCVGYHCQDAPDTKGQTRRAIVFELVPVTRDAKK